MRVKKVANSEHEPRHVTPADAVSFTIFSPRRKPRRCAIATKAASSRKKLQLEMGGKNPLVILGDANLKVAATEV